MAKKYGFGIVGAGMIGDFHARAINDLPNAKLIGFCDQIEPAAKRAADTFGVECTTDYDAFLARDDVDIITICTPSGTHRDVSLPAIKAGKHLVIEKPLEVTLKKCDTIIRAAKKAGVKICGIFPTRFYDGSLAAKKAIDQGRFGRLALGDAYVKWFRSQSYYDKGGWKGTKALDGGGALMNQSIHAIDLLQWLMGPVESVTAVMGTLAHERIEVEDTAVATLRFKNGAIGVIEGATSVYPGFMQKVEISGDKGSVVLEEGDLRIWDFIKGRASDERILDKIKAQTDTASGAADPTAIGYEGHRRQFADFLRALTKGTKPLVDGEESRKAVEIILAVYKAAETGKPVKLPLKGT